MRIDKAPGIWLLTNRAAPQAQCNASRGQTPWRACFPRPALADLGIASITVAATPQTDTMIAGNQVTATGSFTRADNSTGAIADVVFTVDPFHTR